MRTAGGGCAGCSSCEPARGGPPVRVAWNASDLVAAASVRRGCVVVAGGLRVTHDDLAAEPNVAVGERRHRTLLRRGQVIRAVDVVRERGTAVFGERDGSGTGNESGGECDLGQHGRISLKESLG